MSLADSSHDKRTGGASVPRILCTGIIVLDEVFRVEDFPKADGKVEAKGFFVVNGGCAANAAVAIARLGGRAALAGPLGGPAGEDDNGDRVLAALSRENVDTSACQRVDGLATALSAIFIDARGDRTIVTYRDQRIAAVTPEDPERLAASADLVLADNRYPQFARPICEAARRRNVPVVLDGDKPTVVDDPFFRVASQSSFPPSACSPRPAAAISAKGSKPSRAIPTRSSPSATGRTISLSSTAVRSTACRCFRSARWILSAPAMLCTAVLRWRLPRGAAKPKRSASARPSPGSSAPASAARPVRRPVRKSRDCWRKTAHQLWRPLHRYREAAAKRPSKGCGHPVRRRDVSTVDALARQE